MDINESVKYWITHLEDSLGQPYSFDKVDFDTIKQQFLQGQLKSHLSEKPYFFTCMINDQIQVIGIDEVKRDEPDLLATISFLATGSGGRQGYANSGYRPHIRFDGLKHTTSGEQLFLEEENQLLLYNRLKCDYILLSLASKSASL